MYLYLVQLMARLVPNKLPGKTRLFRLLLKNVALKTDTVDVRGRYDLVYRVPDVRESVAFNLICFGLYEEATIQTIISLLPPGGMFLDGGANIGSISLPIARMRPDVTIISVEGDPEIAAILRHNVEANNITNIEVINALLGREDHSRQTFYKAPDHKFGMGSLGNHFGGDGQSLETRSIDGILADRNGSITVIKLDIEGAEVIALSGALDTLTTIPAPTVVFEYQPWAERAISNQKAGDSQRLLLKLGYQLYRVDESETPVRSAITEGHGMLRAEKLDAPD